MNWGFEIHKDSSIDLDRNDRSLALWLDAQEPTATICMACGSCAGTCSAVQYTNFSFRRLLLLVKRGETEGLREEVSKCMFCGKCALVCPRGVNTRHILALVRESLTNNN